MAEEKILIPSYKRVGNCARCGEAVYSPELKQPGGWPLMSACACTHGPQLAHEEAKLPKRKEKLVEQAKAA